jgi:hypothetical protein
MSLLPIVEEGAAGPPVEVLHKYCEAFYDRTIVLLPAVVLTNSHAEHAATLASTHGGGTTAARVSQTMSGASGVSRACHVMPCLSVLCQPTFSPSQTSATSLHPPPLAILLP